MPLLMLLLPFSSSSYYLLSFVHVCHRSYYFRRVLYCNMTIVNKLFTSADVTVDAMAT